MAAISFTTFSQRRISARKSPIHGTGVFALVPIKKGTRIIEYTGEIITEAEGERRYPTLPDGTDVGVAIVQDLVPDAPDGWESLIAPLERLIDGDGDNSRDDSQGECRFGNDEVAHGGGPLPGPGQRARRQRCLLPRGGCGGQQ